MIGLIVGILAPGLAESMAPLIFPMIVFLLFLSVLRVDVLSAFGDWRDVPGAVGISAAMQIGLPLTAIAVLWGIGALDSILGIGVVLVLAAAPLTGSPGLTILAGGDPAPALRQLITGTAILPLTVLPVFWLMPVFGAPEVVAGAAARLLGVIGLAGGIGVWVRRSAGFLQTTRGGKAVDGVITLVMAVVVVGLMSSVGPALIAMEQDIWATLAVVCGLNFGAQAAALFILRRGKFTSEAPALAIIAGNRNLALFLGALPADTGAALLLFIGCYQVPMYLTPMIMGPLVRRL